MVTTNKDYVTRINLKTDANNRKELIDYCLHNDKQYVAIGWSYIYSLEEKPVDNYEVFYEAVKKDIHEKKKTLNPAFNVFLCASKDDLFWTRDLGGNYWICRAIGVAECQCNDNLDIGAVIPVKAYKIGMQVPGQIKALFNRVNGGIVHRIKDKLILEYSKYMYNKYSGEKYYEYNHFNQSIIDNLPSFDLEELVISYLQLEKDYYVLSNSIANKSTTIKIECELISRSIDKRQKAVVQVKAGKSRIIAEDYKEYVEDGYIVYLYANEIDNPNGFTGIKIIKKEELEKFYKKYKLVLPESITMWENLFL